MSAFQKFDCFKQDLGTEVHQLHTDELRAFLTNTAPVAATHLTYGSGGGTELDDLATGNGYTKGGADIQNTFVAGALAGVSITWTAVGGPFGPYRYIVLYNNTAAGKNLIGWWDRGSSFTPVAGQMAKLVLSAGAILTIA